MTSIILTELFRLVGPDFDTIPIFQVAFNQDTNQKLAEVGDCVLNLVVKERAYKNPESTSKSINDVFQEKASKRRNQRFLNNDINFTEFLKQKGCKSPVGKIGLDRADAFMEAILGA